MNKQAIAAVQKQSVSPLQHSSSVSHRVICRHAATFLWLNENSCPRPADLMSQHSAGSHAGSLSSSLVLYHSPSSSQSVQLNGLQEGAVHRLRLLVKRGPHGARASPQRSRYYNIISPTLMLTHAVLHGEAFSWGGNTSEEWQTSKPRVVKGIKPKCTTNSRNTNSVHAETSFSNGFFESSLLIIFLTELRNKNNHFKRKFGFYFFSNNFKKKSCKSIWRLVLLFYL